MFSIQDRLQSVRIRMQQAERHCGRELGAVQLLAVSKQQPVTAIEAAFAAGQFAFGENYIQEALLKMNTLVDKAIEWHFIGSIQSNKTRDIAKYFAWVDSVARVNIAERLSRQRPDGLPPLNICLQVNISNESTKSGFSLPQLAEAIAKIIKLPRLRLRGLMAIPSKRDVFVEQRATYHQLSDTFARLQQQYPELDTLSMGMSADLEAAIAEGATWVRVGTDIFGKREI
jgi:PLP dependent protein